ncbi:hypothetical protein RSOLAG1IB_01817 [Rhizoctonia solani AG-1 IB]|uniref:DNA-binding protein RAP1 n=2 Tax=Thanatephorus cucumeris (strain AG1-IB / isolate 7/3/14) TaxID=1108050 RepID=A0A0B7FDW6_THACB|nr:hypothetical protein RSOLAG1IB_01817 [Rhizoctonia solani AG-1 IB]
MAREHPSVPKASSSKAPLAFDDETDEEEANMRKKNKVASAKKKQSKDLSKLFVKDVEGEEESIRFYIVEWGDWDLIADLRGQITEYGGEVVEERPIEGYCLVDPRTEEGELELATRSTRTRQVVSFLFIEESIKRGSLVPLLESLLFVKEDRPVKFHLHESLDEDEIEDLSHEILLRGGNPDVGISDTQVVIHSKEFRDQPVALKTWRQIELFETSNWLKSCIERKRFTVTGAGGRLTVRPAPRPKPGPQPGRKPGAPRTEFTDHDDQCLIAWMAYKFGKNQAGRQGNRPYQVLVLEADQLWWTQRHTWHSWRERYKTKRAHFDPLIIRAVDEMERDETPEQIRLPEFPKKRNERDADASSEDENVETGRGKERAQQVRPSVTKAKPKPSKRRALDTSDEEDEPEQPKRLKQSSSQPKQIKQSASQSTKPTNKAARKPKPASRPESAPFVKTSASQKAREAPRLRTPTPPASEPSNTFSPARASPPARVESTREESLATGLEDDQGQEDSQSSSTQLDGIIDQAVLGGDAQGAVERHNAELAMVAAEEMEREESGEPYTSDDSDVDVVGITQVDTSPSVHIGMSQPEDEAETESVDKAEETGETVLDTIEVRLEGLVDRYGAMYARVQSYYAHGIKEGMNEADAVEFAEQQLRADARHGKGKGRAS